MNSTVSLKVPCVRNRNSIVSLISDKETQFTNVLYTCWKGQQTDTYHLQKVFPLDCMQNEKRNIKVKGRRTLTWNIQVQRVEHDIK